MPRLRPGSHLCTQSIRELGDGGGGAQVVNTGAAAVAATAADSNAPNPNRRFSVNLFVFPRTVFVFSKTGRIAYDIITPCEGRGPYRC